LEREAAISFSAATRLPELQKDGRKLHPSTLYRWSKAGVRGVVLETVVLGGTRCTTREAVRRFLHKLSCPIGTAPTPTPDQRQHRYESAERRLAASGI
jgi:hypothetical protein